MLCLWGLSMASANVTHAVTVNNLRCEYLDNPLGIEAAQPRLSWKLEDGQARGIRQAAYQVLVATSEDLLKNDKGDLWDSGKVASDQSILVAYAGKPLASGQPCFWKVRVWLASRSEGWSQTAKWTMGLLRPDDWTAQWISFRDTTPLQDKPGALILPPAQHYRKDFSAKKTVARATRFPRLWASARCTSTGRRSAMHFLSQVGLIT